MAQAEALAELRAWEKVLPAGAAFTGLSAARAHGLWLPPLPADLPVMAALARREYETTPVRDGLVVIRHPVAPASMTVGGARVVTVAECLVCCCRHLGLLDAVVLLDSALHQRLCTLDELAIIARRKRRGVRLLRAALELADGRSESAWETMLRLLHVSCGVVVTPQVDLFDERGRFVARVDLMVDETGQIQEYDGAQHRDAVVQLDDLARERRLADIGRTRRAYVARHLLQTPEVVLEPIGAVTGRRLSVRPWRDLLESSLYRDPGRAEFSRRLGAGPLTWT
ncbi:MAG: hypothetical protein QM572_09045 [Nocardioides sp.]|uniref:hypothetical protein n=1 Tax=Nocardioides sp. TaxID=35761 RepID=UPI0039E6ECF2